MLAETIPLMVFGGYFVSIAGSLLPTFGPGRAISIALRSHFAFKQKYECLRDKEVQRLRNHISEKNYGRDCVVVTGEKGVGKTFLLDAVVRKTGGAIKVCASPMNNCDKIVKNVLKELSNHPLLNRNPHYDAKRVIFWYCLFNSKRSPTVIINAYERSVGDGYADISSAIETLVEDYNHRVIVDAMPNSVSEAFLQRYLRRILYVEPMSKQQIWQLDQLSELFKYVKQANLDDTAYAVLGGIPSAYENLWRHTSFCLQGGENPRQIIGAHLQHFVQNAMSLITDAISHPDDMSQIIKLFDKEKKCIFSDTIAENNLKRPSVDIVFREEERDSISVLVPASNAIGIVLQHGLVNSPCIDELEQLLGTKTRLQSQ